MWQWTGPLSGILLQREQEQSPPLHLPILTKMVRRGSRHRRTRRMTNKGKGTRKRCRSHFVFHWALHWEPQNALHHSFLTTALRGLHWGCAHLHSKERTGVIHKPGNGGNKTWTQGYIIGHLFSFKMTYIYLFVCAYVHTCITVYVGGVGSFFLRSGSQGLS